MEKIIIKKNPNGDTRTAPKGITIDDFMIANDSHRKDVFNVMNALASKVTEAGHKHDWTKVAHTKYDAYENGFYNDFVATQEGKLNFIEGDWYKMHVEKERHHLLSHCPEDVNLIDVLEMVVDCTCAGLARSGEVRPMEINEEILKKAMNNTVELIKGMVEVVD